MTKLLLKYTGEDEPVSCLKCGQLLEVDVYESPEGIYYTYTNKYGEEMYISPKEVATYE